MSEKNFLNKHFAFYFKKDIINPLMYEHLVVTKFIIEIKIPYQCRTQNRSKLILRSQFLNNIEKNVQKHHSNFCKDFLKIFPVNTVIISDDEIHLYWSVWSQSNYRFWKENQHWKIMEFCCWFWRALIFLRWRSAKDNVP